MARSTWPGRSLESSKRGLAEAVARHCRGSLAITQSVSTPLRTWVRLYRSEAAEKSALSQRTVQIEERIGHVCVTSAAMKPKRQVTRLTRKRKLIPNQIKVFASFPKKKRFFLPALSP
jgi:hypothetical protein